MYDDKIDMEKLRAEIRHMECWEPWIVPAAIFGAAASMAGVIVLLAQVI